MSISITTDHLLLDGGGLTIKARGYEISWMGTDPRPGSGRELIIERLSDGSSWNWRRGLRRWTVMGDGSFVDGWQRASS